MTFIEQSISKLEDLASFIRALNDSDYNCQVPHFSSATLGQHVRHVIEFYQCLIDQMPSGIINYCLRKRDLSIERDSNIALHCIAQIKAALPGLDTSKELLLKNGRQGESAVTTNVNRELLYNIEHTTHHLALLRIGALLLNPDMQIPDHFGVAASTISHRKSSVAS